MEFHKFKSINEKVSLLGFGLMRLPKIDESKPDIDYVLAEKMIDLAMKSGVTYYDTAFPYHDGLSEKFVGDVLSKYDRSSYYLASKMPMWKINTIEDADEIFESQLKKCNTPYFDFYLWHALNKNTFQKGQDIGLWDLLTKKKAEGKIKHIGFSFHDTVDVLDIIAKSHPWEFAQVQLNYYDYNGSYRSKEQYEILEKLSIPTVIMEPVKGGTLANLPDNVSKLFKEKEPNFSVASWAIRYATSFPNVLVVLSGMSTLNQVVDNLDTMNNYKKLDDSDYQLIDKAVEIYHKSVKVACTACGYCVEENNCTKSIPIPKVFKAFNLLSVSEDAFVEEYNKLGDNVALSCINCKRCEKRCPQSLPIPKLLDNVADKYFRLTK